MAAAYLHSVQKRIAFRRDAPEMTEGQHRVAPDLGGILCPTAAGGLMTTAKALDLRAPASSPGDHPRTAQPYAEDTELLAVIRSHLRDSPQREAACRSLVDRYRWLVSACARRYQGSPEPIEDLMQAGYVGLLKAINSFNPDIGTCLEAYARPCVSGEIKRHFRDKRWQVHVKRSVQELRLEMRTATAELTQRLQRAPAEAEVARFLRISTESLADVRSADLAFHPVSFDAPVRGGRGDGASELAELVGAADARLDTVIDLAAVGTHWPQLPAIQQRVLLLRFYGNKTQADIGAQLGISQMQVSRLQTRALSFLRTAILDTA
jgi:RNA polymerase sigma-B factor